MATKKQVVLGVTVAIYFVWSLVIYLYDLPCHPSHILMGDGQKDLKFFQQGNLRQTAGEALLIRQDLLISAVQFLTVNRIHNWWIGCGALLGIKRQKGLILWDLDVDIELSMDAGRQLFITDPPINVSYDLEYISQTRHHNEFPKRFTSWHPNILGRLCTRNGGLCVEFWIKLIVNFLNLAQLLKVEDAINTLSCLRYFKTTDCCRESYTIFPLQTITLSFGIVVNVPNNIEKFLIDLYGARYLSVPIHIQAKCLNINGKSWVPALTFFGDPFKFIARFQNQPLLKNDKAAMIQLSEQQSQEDWKYYKDIIMEHYAFMRHMCFFKTSYYIYT